jgi:hypothetical protein
MDMAVKRKILSSCWKSNPGRPDPTTTTTTTTTIMYAYFLT